MLADAGLELALLPPHEWKETHAVLTESPTNSHATTSPAPQSNPQYKQLLQVAEQLNQKCNDWVTFFREMMGIDGVIRQTFPNFDDLTEFERSEEFSQSQKMLVKLRESKATGETETEPTRVITVRLPKSMHEYLRTEAHDLRTSMNKLCISKLLQMIEQDLIPADQTALPKRRNSTPTPTPQQSAAAQPQQPSLAGNTPQPSLQQPLNESPFRSNGGF